MKLPSEKYSEVLRELAKCCEGLAHWCDIQRQNPSDLAAGQAVKFWGSRVADCNNKLDGEDMLVEVPSAS